MRKTPALHRLARLIAGLGATVALAACGSMHYPVNEAIQQADPQSGYRPQQAVSRPGEEELFVILTFSGGGTRAAALAFGALEELSRQEVVWRGERKRIIDEVDIVFGVSGGAITAAYWGLRGDQALADFEERFLKQDMQSTLLKSLMATPNLVRLGSPRFGRGDLLAERLDAALFDGATFADLAKNKSTPFVVISAADLSNGARFDFSQNDFDLLCSDLSSFPIARAVAASAAVPLVFSPIALKNYAGQCNYSPPDKLAQHHESNLTPSFSENRTERRAKEMASYLDASRKPFVHLVDGGVADNLAISAILEASEPLVAGHDEANTVTAPTPVRRPPHMKKILFVVVDAGTDANSQVSLNGDVPKTSEVMDALADIPIRRFSAETRELLKNAVDKWKSRSKEQSIPELYLVDVSLRSISDPRIRHSLMKLPTTLFLYPEEVAALRQTAADLIRQSPDFQRLTQEIGAERAQSLR